MKRCFISLNLPENIKAEFARIQADLKCKNQGIRVTWVDPKIAHINLHFLGDLDENRVNLLKEKLGALEGKYGPILALLTGIGAFPSLKMPRILFLGVKHKGENNLSTSLKTSLIKLYQDSGKILKEQNLSIDDRPFIAHITLGRAKDRNAKVKFTGEEMPDIEFKINSFELMESVLRPDGPEYRTLSSTRL